MFTYLYYAAERKLALRGIDTIPKGEKLLPVKDAMMCIKLTGEIINKSFDHYGEPVAYFADVLNYQRSLVIYKEKDNLYGLKICLVSFERVLDNMDCTDNADFETSVTIARHCTIKEIYDYILSICQYGKSLIAEAKSYDELERLRIDVLDVTIATKSIMDKKHNGYVIANVETVFSIDHNFKFDDSIINQLTLDDFIQAGNETTFTYQED